MKQLLHALTLALLLTPALQAADITSEERTKAVRYLEKTRDELKSVTKGLSEAQWNFKPAPERWSIAEIAEHLATSEVFIMDTVRDTVMKAPPAGERNVQEVDEFILATLPDRSKKVQAPEPLRPANRFASPKESLKSFADGRKRTIQFVKETKDLRDHAIDSPFGKPLDGYQWILLVAAHTDRHLKQLAEVKADPAFPKK